MKNKIILIIVLVFACLQLFNPEKIPFKEPTEADFTALEKPNEEVKLLIQKICYDCHSNQINYPWYSRVAPVSWWLADHIEEGREHLNFSEWGNYAAGKKAHKAEECYEEIEEGEMPLESYTFIHRSADLDEEERALLIDYFKSIEKKYN